MPKTKRNQLSPDSIRPEKKKRPSGLELLSRAAREALGSSSSSSTSSGLELSREPRTSLGPAAPTPPSGLELLSRAVKTAREGLGPSSSSSTSSGLELSREPRAALGSAAPQRKLKFGTDVEMLQLLLDNDCNEMMTASQLGYRDSASLRLRLRKLGVFCYERISLEFQIYRTIVERKLAEAQAKAQAQAEVQAQAEAQAETQAQLRLQLQRESKRKKQLERDREPPQGWQARQQAKREERARIDRILEEVRAAAREREEKKIQ